MNNIKQVISGHAVTAANKTAFTFIEENGTHSHITFKDLHLSALNIASNLKKQRDSNDRVVILLPQGLEYVQTFLGCLYAGVIAVPLFPPVSKKHSGRVDAVIQDCTALIAITTDHQKEKISGILDNILIKGFSELSVNNNSELLSNDEIIINEQDTAFLQYTSGSTGNPKGVMVSHQNIIANIHAIQTASQCSQDDVFCNWLPLFHDMGIINTLLLPVYTGAHSVLMSSAHFMKLPIVWFEAITQYKATACGGPNFAYNHCVNKITEKQLTNIDLSSWKMAFNGAEPINDVTLNEFSNIFAKVGFKSSALYPCYGMAEATLFISGGNACENIIVNAFEKESLQNKTAILSNNKINSSNLVACGQAAKQHSIKIVNPQTKQKLNDGQIGEIWFAGPSVTKGYWNDQNKTDETFGLTLIGDTHKYMRTGDLGFFFDDQLYISGRIKDVMIVAGKNYYPQDFELIASKSSEGFALEGCAAFELNGETTIIQEVHRHVLKKIDFDKSSQSIVLALFESFDIMPHDVVFIKAGTLKRTSSGKIQRSLIQQEYIEDKIDYLYSKLKNTAPKIEYEAPITNIEKQLCQLWQDELDVKQVGLNDNFLSLGGHSLLASNLVASIRKALGCDLTLTDLFESENLKDLALKIESAAPINETLNISTQKSAQPQNQLSFAQQRLWLTDKIAGSSNQYNICRIYEIKGDLNVDALNYTFKSIVQRHHVLRTVFDSSTSIEPKVQLLDNEHFKIQFHDYSLLDSNTATNNIEDLILNQTNQVFDLACDFMLRVNLIKTQANAYTLVLAMHHIAVDGWSQHVLINELNTIYQAYIQNKTDALPELTIQYSDYAAWQRNWMKGDVLTNHMDYWKQNLENIPEVHNFPLDFPRPKNQDFTGKHHYHEISAQTQHRLNLLAKQKNVTLYMLINAAFSLLLSRYSNETDIVIGTPVGNRDQSELTGLIGFFVNSIVVRTDVSKTLTFDALLKNTKKNLLCAYEYQQLPFDKLVEQLQTNRNLSISPLFQIKLALQNNDKGSINLNDLTFKNVQQSHSVALHDISLDVHENTKDGEYLGLTLDWEYATSLFKQNSIVELSNNFEALLNQLIINPELNICEYELLSDQTHAQALLDGQPKVNVQRPTKFIHHDIEKQAVKHPNDIAVCFNNEKISYQELNEKANQVARYLLEQEVVPNTLVGICIERSVEMIIGIVGILKSGAAYVPIDPSYPENRIDHILDDSKIEIILTEAELMSELSIEELKVLPLDEDFWDAFLGGYSTENLNTSEVDLNESDLAYIIYTSGSTGKPKGVAVSHQNLSYSTHARTSAYANNPTSFALLSSFSFDSSVVGIFWTLATGGQLTLIETKNGIDPNEFQAILIKQNISHFLTLPSVYLNLIQANIEAPKSLQMVLVAGEECSTELVNNHFKNDGWHQARLINEYGPTEATVWSTYYECKPSDMGKVPIGIAAPHCELYVLDEHKKLCPTGVIGELYVGGPAVAKGYLDQKELTLEKFVNNPFSNNQSNMYKTGDLVKWVSNNGKKVIEFVGRIDNQIKIRGYRVELSEIESTILNFSGISEAVVVAVGEPKQLVAYVKASNSSDNNIQAALKQYLSNQLSDYMNPSAIMMLENFPTTANGKLDRNKLPEPEFNNSTTNEYKAPQTDIEKTLCDIWQGLLQIEKIGIDDNFFSIGGDSILSIQLVARATKAGLFITVRQIFECQTIKKLATVVNTESKVEAPQIPTEGEQILLPIQYEFINDEQTDKHYYNQSLLLEIPDDFSIQILNQTIIEIYKRHDTLRLSFSENRGGLNATYNELTTQMTQRVVKQYDLSGLEKQEWLSKIETLSIQEKSSLNIHSADLFRAVLFDGENRRLLLTMHHLVVDGVSWRILLQDFSTIFEQLTHNQDVALLPKTSSYQQWAEYLQEVANSDFLQNEKKYWENIIQATVSSLKPSNKIIDSVAEYNEIDIQLNEVDTQLLLNNTSKSYQTNISDLLLSALYLALNQTSGDSVFRIDLEGHGREDLNQELNLGETVGWFTTVYPFLMKLDPADDVNNIGNIIKSIKQNIRTIPNNGIGFSALNTYAESISTNNATQSEILFNYLGQFDQVLSKSETFTLATESTGAEQSENRQRNHPLAFNGYVSAGSLKFSLTYNRAAYSKQTMLKLIDSFKSSIVQIIRHCQNNEPLGFTPSDFPLALIDQPLLDQLHSQYPNIENLYPATGMQQGLLFHSSLDRSAYVTQLSIGLKGQLNISAMQTAWMQVLKRHACFRTVFVNDNALQLVLKNVILPFNQNDFSDLNQTEQPVRFNQFLDEDKALGFDITTTPLMRITISKFAADQYKLIWTNHHALSDGWSMPIVFKEVLSLYQSINNNECSDLYEVKPYENYIAWIQNQDSNLSQEFWVNELAMVSSITELNCSIGSTESKAVIANKKSFKNQYGKQPLTLDTTQTKNLLNITQFHQVTLSTIVQGAWSYLLHRYSGENTVIFGETISGRPADLIGVEQMVGLFINTLPVVVDFNQSDNIGEFLQNLHKNSIARSEHGYIPLSKIQEKSPLGNNTALFDSLVIFENYPINELANNASLGCGFEIEDIQNSEETNYGLTLMVTPGDQLHFELAYKRDCYNEKIVLKLLKDLNTILDSFWNVDIKLLSELSLTSSNDQNTLEKWNHTDFNYPKDQCFHEIFEQQAAQFPDSIAVCFNNNQLSYKQLNEKSNQLAHYLKTMGVSVGTLVGCCVERSLDLLVSLLAIHKAGGAYVPLDPEYPKARLEHMVNDSALRYLISNQSVLQDIAVNHVVNLDNEKQRLSISQMPITNLLGHKNGLTAKDLAYVIYTSGSTGLPKGVMVEHQNLNNFLHSMQHKPGLTCKDTLLAVTSVSFDIHTLELFLPLLTGAQVIIASQQDVKDPVRLETLINKYQVNIMQATPSTWKMLMQNDWTPSLPIKVLCGGEALSVELKNNLLSQSCVELWNMFGPTETAVWSSVQKIETSVLIGKPIANTQMYILDKHLRHTPMGVAGQLYIAGDGVTRGYLGQDSLTHEKFITHPFTKDYSSKLYATGDLVRYSALQDGTIEYLGRIDNQIKIRGYRVELGEIESVLLTHESISEAVVIDSILNNGDKSLFACVVITGSTLNKKTINKQTVNSVLNSYLSNALPNYMIPSGFMIVDEIALLPNKKVDRAFLSTVIKNQQPLNYVVPESDTQKTLCAICEKLLNIKKVSLLDNFFALGGDSLSTLVFVRNATEMGLNCPPQMLFEYSNFAELASAIDHKTNANRDHIIEDRLIGEVPLSAAQHLFFEYIKVNPNIANIGVVTEFKSALNIELLEKSLLIMANHHDALRAKFEFKQNKWHQFLVNPKDLNIAIEQIDYSAETQTNQQNLIHKHFEKSRSDLNLGVAPLLKIFIFNCGDDQGFIVKIMLHHLIVDGYSINIFFEDWQKCYQSLVMGQAYTTPQKTATMYDNVNYFIDFTNQLDAQQEIEYWSNLPWDQVARFALTKQKANDEASMQNLDKVLSVESTEKLLQLSQHLKIPMVDILMSALSNVLTTFADSKYLALKVLDSGRQSDSSSIDLSSTIGWLSTNRVFVLEAKNVTDSQPNNLKDGLRFVHNQIQNTSHKGFSYELLRYFHHDQSITEQIKNLPRPNVLLNYAGVVPTYDSQASRLLSELKYIDDAIIPWVSPENERDEIFGCFCHISDSQLHIRWKYSENYYSPAQMNSLLKSLTDYLQALVINDVDTQTFNVIQEENI
ncbi:amino acid adenylation domain-containing protein [Marinicellulosiphila megalodicopiae]|uniref:amino acid adenylation domain-containing protein n=1 Tax=Marinicellulosiphila megalodicopiae TaxID=2724896 RepID=UPI003BB21FD8